MAFWFYLWVLLELYSCDLGLRRGGEEMSMTIVEVGGEIGGWRDN